MSGESEEERDDDVRAGEYVLHLLDPAERAAFEARLEVEGGLRQRVALWTESFAALAAEVAEVAPPAALRRRLEQAIAAAPRAERPAQPRASRFWGRLAGIAAVAAVVVGVFVALNRETLFGLSPAIYIADMESADSPFVLRAGYHPDEAALVVNRSAGEVPPGRVLELWLIAPGASAPVSLGVLPDEDSVTLTVPEPLRPVLAGATLAISDEPPGGSPTGAPTGSVLAAGPLNSV